MSITRCRLALKQSTAGYQPVISYPLNTSGLIELTPNADEKAKVNALLGVLLARDLAD